MLLNKHVILSFIDVHPMPSYVNCGVDQQVEGRGCVAHGRAVGTHAPRARPRRAQRHLQPRPRHCKLAHGHSLV